LQLFAAAKLYAGFDRKGG